MRISDRWYNRISRDARYNDGKAGRVIDPNIIFITTRRLLELQNEQQNKCYYCQSNMCWIERKRNPLGLTLERLDNSLPHYEANCVLACKHCNSKKFTPDQGLLRRYFTKWKNIALDVRVQSSGDRRAGFAWLRLFVTYSSVAISRITSASQSCCLAVTSTLDKRVCPGFCGANI